MASITVELSEERASKLRETASGLGLTADELVRLSIDDLLERPAEDFRRALGRVLKKNAELYRRLA